MGRTGESECELFRFPGFAALCRVFPSFTPGTPGTWRYLSTLATLLGRRSLPQIPSPPLLPCLARVQGSSPAHPGQAAEIRRAALSGVSIFVKTPDHQIVSLILVYGACMLHTLERCNVVLPQSLSVFGGMYEYC
jgi:hypothetical protein